MFRIVCDPSSGSIELYLTEIIGSGSLKFFVCLVGVWQRNFEPVVCVRVCVCVCVYGTTDRRHVVPYTHTTGSKITICRNVLCSKSLISVVAKFSAPVQTGPGSNLSPVQGVPGLFQRNKARGGGASSDHLNAPSAEVKERVQLYIYSSARPSWPFPGRTLSFISLLYSQCASEKHFYGKFAVLLLCGG